MKMTKVKKGENNLYEYEFEGTDYASCELLRKWIVQIIDSRILNVTLGKIRISDDLDAPVQKDFYYTSADELKEAVSISDTDIEVFYISGEYNGVNIGIAASVWGKKNLSIIAPKGFDAETLVNRLGFE